MSPSSSSLANIPRATPGSHSWRRRWLGTPSYWVAQLIGWGGLLLVQLIAAFSKERYAAALPITLFTLTAIAATHLFRVHLIRLRSQSHTWLALVARVLAGLLATAAACTLISAFLSHHNSTGLTPAERFSYLSTSLGLLSVLVPWLSLYFGINYYRSYQQSTLDRLRLEAAVKDAELRLLRAQVDPHFLFNSLNTLRALIPRELTAPREVVTRLSEVLRNSLHSATHHTVPLSEELEHVENYLVIEKLRFAPRLRFTQTIAPAALPCLIPTLLLQTLVENAIKHGIATSETGGSIELSAHLDATHVVVTVTNPGTLHSSGTTSGLGLKNARARLTLLFGPAATLELAQIAPDLVRVTVRIPLAPPSVASTSA